MHQKLSSEALKISESHARKGAFLGIVDFYEKRLAALTANIYFKLTGKSFTNERRSVHWETLSSGNYTLFAILIQRLDARRVKEKIRLSREGANPDGDALLESINAFNDLVAQFRVVLIALANEHLHEGVERDSFFYKSISDYYFDGPYNKLYWFLKRASDDKAGIRDAEGNAGDPV